MAKDTIGFALSAVNKFAGSSLVKKLKLQRPAEKIAYLSTRTGFQVVSSTNATVQQAKAFFKQTTPTKEQQAATLFDPSLSEDQRLIKDTLDRFSSDIIRDSAYEADSQAATPDEVFQQANELGMLAYSVSEQYGGFTDTPSTVSNLIIIEALASGDMGIATALLSTISVANILTRWGTEAQQSSWLAPLTRSLEHDKGLFATVAINEPSPLFNPNKLKTRVTPIEDGYLLNGKKSAVAIGERADFFLVAASSPGGEQNLFIVNSALKGISVESSPAMGLKAAELSTITFKDVQLPLDALLGDEHFCYQTCIDLSNLAGCALAIGCAQAIQDYVIKYCNERIAFGEPVSHRQSVAFMIANMGIELEGMRLLTYRAASRCEQGLPFHREAYLAKVLCADKAMEIGTNGVQLLGGHGFIKEHPVERWYRDMRSIAILYGLHA
ncbi:acyl-CoA dehydrogenase family protein [Alkalimarinus sediminis]|uniref:Acyl-CoA/acyl-ACP dehydrogenase n=1 Tax=Alkalimarinus sediminis TaxID=1632866 RepID=A0A9E8KPT5_9ALTE|nr:acyl-CoA dehydrogenase family protein [Alkalimarinus sediminis]UZW75668.1 acyl-CoA/acyl-ACP dehydrogenase [Alkalimarinus sediminis]